MEENKNDKNLIDDVAQLIETYRDLITLRVVEQASLGGSISAVGIIALLFMSCILLFFGLGAAWWVGEMMNNLTYGFLIVGGVYLIVLVVLLATAQKFTLPAIRNFIIKKIYEQHQ